MNNLPKITKLWRKGRLLSSGFILAIFLSASPSAPAQCANWDASGALQISQGGGVKIKLQLNQNSRTLSGRAEQTIPATKGFLGIIDKYGSITQGNVLGSIHGNDFSIQISWTGGLVGIYNAQVSPTGKLEGKAYEKKSPNVLHAWNSVGTLKCAPAAPIIPKIIRSSGKAKPNPKPSADGPVKIPVAPQKPPYINLGQAIITTPMAPLGIVPLSWDGGPDNPHVKVWLSMDNGPEIPAFSPEHGPQSQVWKQAKVSFLLHLQRYHHYKFVLKDAVGNTLATAGVVVP